MGGSQKKCGSPPLCASEIVARGVGPDMTDGAVGWTSLEAEQAVRATASANSLIGTNTCGDDTLVRRCQLSCDMGWIVSVSMRQRFGTVDPSTQTLYFGTAAASLRTG